MVTTLRSRSRGNSGSGKSPGRPGSAGRATDSRRTALSTTAGSMAFSRIVTKVEVTSTVVTTLPTVEEPQMTSIPAREERESSDDLSDIAPEIVVWTEEMDVDTESRGNSAPAPSVDESPADPHVAAPIERSEPPSEAPSNTLLGVAAPAVVLRESFSSSMSALSDQSELSSIPPSNSSRATTPIEVAQISNVTPMEESEPPAVEVPLPGAIPATAPQRLRFRDIQPKSDRPSNLPPRAYNDMCVKAAWMSRLEYDIMDPGEVSLLDGHITNTQVTVYLNMRNRILRFWASNPSIAVTREEAVRCAPSTQWFEAASLCFDWLVRRGFINFGCVDRKVREHEHGNRKQRTIVVIGAGMSGLGCTRQLEGLINQYSDCFIQAGESPPRVIALEGRNRIGGRVYSKMLNTAPPKKPSIPAERATVELGGMIITGFEKGNPMNILVRGQMGLPYKDLDPATPFYDTNGKPPQKKRDTMVQNLYDDLLERVSAFKWEPEQTVFVKGNTGLILENLDPADDAGQGVGVAGTEPLQAQRRDTGNSSPKWPVSIAEKAVSHGWKLPSGIQPWEDISLNLASKADDATLGSIFDLAIMQTKPILGLDARDFRLLNWHLANLEYGNASNLKHLSLGGWDQDHGNEWDGQHSMVIGGYQRVPRALLHCPTQLSIRMGSAVAKIESVLGLDAGEPPRSVVYLENGEKIEAEYVVCTVPLGVLKSESIQFSPSLPTWKTDTIGRMGFGILNKVILAYREEDVFWDMKQDIMGVLQEPLSGDSLEQTSYSEGRGRFFQWFNVTKTTLVPCLVALMAGDAAHAAENTSDAELAAEAKRVLQRIYGNKVADPVEVLVTRWGQDRFARGTYSSSGPKMQPNDYNLMARRVGNIFFAGEHTIGTHPATVHGAYLSGLRAAGEVLDAMLGPIQVPTPLITPGIAAGEKRKTPSDAADAGQVRPERRQNVVPGQSQPKSGARPAIQPEVREFNYTGHYLPKDAFDLYRIEREQWVREKGLEPWRHDPITPLTPVEAMLRRMWEQETPEERGRYEGRFQRLNPGYKEELERNKKQVLRWDRDAGRLRAASEQPLTPSPNMVERAKSAVRAHPPPPQFTKYFARPSDNASMDFTLRPT